MSVRPGQVDTSERPFIVAWELTQACDLSCDHCRAEATPERHPDELTTSEGKDLLDELAAFGENQLVVFTGGDALKRPDLVELVEYATEAGLAVALTPSATGSITRNRLKALKEAGVRRIALSLDGATRASHDSFRGESGSFDSIVKASRWADEIGLPVQINTTVCQATVDDLPAIARRVEGLNAVLWALFFLVPVGRGIELEPLSPPEAEKQLRWVAQSTPEWPFGVKTTEAPMYRRIVAQVDEGPPQGAGGKHGIIAGDGFMFISHTGEVTPSGFLPQSVGNVRHHDPVSLYRGADLFRALRDRSRLTGKCGDCEFKHLCGGSRSRAFASTGDALASDPLCPYEPKSATTE